jgi:F-type H+-transporting ATPase subunit epsilon
MQFRILTPERRIAEIDVQAVTLPGVAGELTPMEGHDRLVTPLAAGRLIASTLDAENRLVREVFQIGKGFAEVLHDAVTVFTGSATKLPDSATP